jgi:predicted nuclease with RNAse H fold
MSAPAGAAPGADHGAEQATGGATEQEVRALRARVEALEAELVEVSARAHAIVAAAQDQTYWLERWHVDLNALMRRPGADQFRLGLRAIRSVARRTRRLKRRLSS